MKNKELSKKTIVVYFDGLCKSDDLNGIATYSFVVYKDGVKIHEELGVVGEGKDMNSSIAEYTALCKALKFLINKGLNKENIIIKSDNRFIIDEMNKWLKPRNKLYDKYKEALILLEKFPKLSLIRILRKYNYEAHFLCRRAYTKYCSKKGIIPKSLKKYFEKYKELIMKNIKEE